MHLETALYYTLSTISQTLAAALGLLAAVVLFALDRIERQLENSASDVLTYTDGVYLPTPLITRNVTFGWSVLLAALGGVVVCVELYRRLLRAILATRRLR